MIEIGNKIIGTINTNKSGSAYFASDDIAKDIYLYKGNRNTALHLDLVEVEVIKGRGRDLECKVLKVIERFRTNFVGTIKLGKNGGVVTPMSNKMCQTFFIPKNGLGDVKDGQKVVVKMIPQKKQSDNLKGEIIEIVGNPGDNETEINAIMREYNLPSEFNQDVLDESSVISNVVTIDDITSRRDMRNIPTFTIDPETARDFDDALSMKALKDGSFEVGVHIADVTHYVRTATELDKEALQRGTSVYLVDRVVPMLPEHLSNNVCSLRPDEDKLTFSVVFNIDRIGAITKTWMGKTVIRSNKRFTYEEAEDIIQNSGDEIPEDLTRYAIDIKALNFIATMLREDRLNNDSVVISRSEFKFELDDNSKPIEIVAKKHLKSQELIEEFMLLANKAVAEFVNKKGLPMVNRVHDKPDPEKLIELKAFLSNFNLNLKIGKDTKESITDILTKVQGTPIEDMVNQLITRVMSKAIYSTNNIGHYGLGFENYTHFTSPIRRYSDMIVHRLLEMYLRGKVNISLAKLEGRCEHISRRERVAQKGERESVKYKQVEYMADKIGTLHRGRVVSILNEVMFIVLDESGVDCILPYSNMGGRYDVDKSRFFIKSDETGIQINIGDTMMVKIISTDLDRRRVEVESIGVAIG